MVPPSDPDRQDATAPCPHCRGLGSLPWYPPCPPCSGTGRLTAERAVALYCEAHRRFKAESEKRREKAAEVARLRDLVDSLSANAWHRNREKAHHGRLAAIAAMGDRILTLKVELARATGADLERLIPHAANRERALTLAARLP